MPSLNSSSTSHIRASLLSGLPLSSHRQIKLSDLNKEPEIQCPFFFQCFHAQHWAQSALRSWLICTPSPGCSPALLSLLASQCHRNPQGAIQHPLEVLSCWVGVLWSSSNKHQCVCQQRFPKEPGRGEWGKTAATPPRALSPPTTFSPGKVGKF